MGNELTLQSKLGTKWEHIYRIKSLPRVDAEYRSVLTDEFGLRLPDADLRTGLAHVEQRGTRGPSQTFFA